jgi:phage-related protein
LSLNPKEQEKVEYIFKVIRTVDRIPKKFLKYIENGLFEIRIELGNNIFRVFCCFDEGRVVVLFNGFQKKSQRTPRKEIDKALKLKREYFYIKKGGSDETD